MGRFTTWRRWSLALTSLAVVALTAWIGLTTVRQMEAANRALADTELPLFDRMQALRAGLAMQAMVFHHYYLTGDGAAFARDLERESAQIEATLARLGRDLGDDPALAALRTDAARIGGIAGRLDAAMRSPTDWDGARAALAELTPLAEDINTRSLDLTATVRRRIAERAQASLRRTERSVFWTALMGAAMLVAAITLLWLNARRVAAQHELRHLAYHDPLTGLPNRAAFSRRLDACCQGGGAVTVAMLDLDRFAQIVSRAGHTMADEAMRRCAERLRSVAEGAGAEIFRFEGKHFGLLVPPGREQDASPLLDALHAAMAEPLQVDGCEFFLTLSAGVAATTPESPTLETALRRADVAMRDVMTHGGGGTRVHDDALERRWRARIDTEAALRHAIERDELRLYLQPQASLRDGRVIGAEALLRWQPRDGGLIPPTDFIPVAEETGLIVDIGEWVIERSCDIAAHWRSRHRDPMTIAVNVSPRQLLHGRLPEQVERLLRRYGLPADRLELEITESAALSDIEAAIATLRELRALGVRLALDDFGTGYSALNYLTRLPLDKLKIDQSFVREMLVNPRDEAVARAVVALAEPLSLTVIAEGVESREQSRRLADWGCDEIQGYLLARPMPAGEFDDWLTSHETARWRATGSM